MARAVVLSADLLFGSRVQESLRAAGHEVELVGGAAGLESRLVGCDVLVVDLTDERLGGVEAVGALGETRPRTLGFYSHVDVETRERAQQAGFDLVVPRSRMAREGGELVSRLAAARSG
jgi:DNA-binding NarL/FixJ family response regulator